jgi:CRISPR-associated endonuclease/helicase Cas3
MPAPKRKRPISPGEQWGPQHEDCWAKTTEKNEPGINVRDHCLNVGCVAEALLAILPEHLRKLLPPGAATLAALHDVGKVSPGFQQKCGAWLIRQSAGDRAAKEGWNVGEPDHAKVSQFTVQELLGKSQLYPWAAILGAHHGRIKGERVSVRAPWEEQRRRLAEELINQFGQIPVRPPDTEATLWFVAGLITISDWIGSDEQHFPQDAHWEMTERRRRAKSALARIHWQSTTARQLGGFSELFPDILQANSLQIATMQAVREPGIYIIEGPMGCGKTEAALAAAYQLIAAGKATGLYFALPTQVTSNRIHLRVQPFVDRISADPSFVRLAHSASWLVDSEPPPRLRPTSSDLEAQAHVRAGRSWFASSKRALLEPFGVGTIDQALLGIVAANHFFVRQFGLAGKVVILDEVHSYDLYTSTLIDVLVGRLRELQCTVIVLSATLTGSRRRQLLQASEQQSLSDAYPLLSGIADAKIEIPCEPPPAKTISVRFITGEDNVEECINRAEQGQCVLWIRNTVDEAQETYRALKSTSHEGGPEIALLHSRFPYFRREHLEADWMKRLGKDAENRPHGCVLVSTQVAEQSVDIDADLLITDLAPTDMLLQRMGRMWRHERERPADWKPEVWIRSLPLSEDQLMQATEKELRAALGKSARVYAPYVLLRSLQQWRNRDAITLPADIRTILEATYAEPAAAEPGAWRQLRDELEKRKRKLAALALSSINIWAQPSLPDEEGVQTRFSTYPTACLLLARTIESVNAHTVRLHFLEGEPVEASGRNWNFDAAKAIYRNLTRVPCWAVFAGLLNMPCWLSNHISQPTAVGLLRSDGGISWAGSDTETGLSYYQDRGITINRKCVTRVPQEEFDESYD